MARVARRAHAKLLKMETSVGFALPTLRSYSAVLEGQRVD
jgi:hypothetical protein